MRREHGDLREADPRGRVSTIQADGLFESVDGPAEVLDPTKVAALEVAAASPRRRARGDLVLHRKDVRGFPVVALRPELVAARDVGQLRGDPKAAARPLGRLHVEPSLAEPVDHVLDQFRIDELSDLRARLQGKVGLQDQ